MAFVPSGYARIRPSLQMPIGDKWMLRIVLAILAANLQCATSSDMPPSQETKPAVAEVFSLGVLSTMAAESYPAFAPDGRTVYFKRSADRSPSSKPAIYESHLSNGSWSEPQVASFSGVYRDADPFVSSDGRLLFFTSDRPANGEAKQDMDIWVTERRADGWDAPRHLGPVVNSPETEASPVVTSSGTLYFSSTRKGGMGSGDLYRSALADGAYAEPENLGEAVNSSHGEWNCVVSPDESLLIFEGSGRAENLSPPGDLYLSRLKNREWTHAVHLEHLSSEGSDLSPRFSPDGKYLFFASNREGLDDNLDLYRIELDAVLARLE